MPSVTAIVAGAIVRGHTVLAAQRRSPASLAGLWEFPGGKVERGESEADALVREIYEELGITVRADRLLGRTTIEPGQTLALYLCKAIDGERPRTGPDHSALRWLTPDELDDVNWVHADKGFLPAVRRPLIADQDDD